MSNITQLILETPAIHDITAAGTSPFWKGTPFELLKNKGPKVKGKIGEHICSDLVSLYGIKTETPRQYAKRTGCKSSSQYDRVFASSIKVEVKLSCAWEETLNNFKWQQLRQQDYDVIMFIGINPSDANVWWATKPTLEREVFGHNQFRQHGGKDGGAELYWVQQQPWFQPFDSLIEYLRAPQLLH